MENIVIIGASKGIGKAISLELAKKNTHIILVSRDKENLEKTKLECEEKGGSAEVFKCDLLNEQDIKGLCGHLKQIKIDIFISFHKGLVEKRYIILIPPKFIILFVIFSSYLSDKFSL